MREIKFRAWDGKKMVTANDIVFSGEKPIAYWKENSVIERSDIIMQYTGLKDILGKEIYEGDILQKTGKQIKFNGRIPQHKIVGNVKKVVYHDGCFRLKSTCNSKRYHLSSVAIAYYGFEIIGNIFENSDLIK